MELSLIVFTSSDGIIGVSGKKLFCPNYEDNFECVTRYSPSCQKNLLIVGRKTYDTIPKKLLSCDRREYLVMTRNLNYSADVMVFNEWHSIMQYVIDTRDEYYKVFIIGGAEIYSLAMDSGFVTEILISTCQRDIADMIVDDDVTRWSPNTSGYHINSSQVSTSYITISNTVTIKEKIIIKYYLRTHLPFEMEYIRLLRRLKRNGVDIAGRNGSVKRITNQSFTIDLNDGFPILTLRRSFWKGIVAELIWMLRGSTDVTELQKDGIHIWDGNSSRIFLDNCGLTEYLEWDIGPGYGYQMRHSGHTYTDCKTDYTGKGVDQIKTCIDLIKRDPNSRRIIINLWGVKHLDKMALPPCHMNYQFTVEDGKLSCHLYQRSWDVLLGWNTSTAALLTHIMAKQTGLGVGTLTHTSCDTHIYLTDGHMRALEQIFSNVPYKLPKLIIEGTYQEDPGDYQSTQFKLLDYRSHPGVKINMVA
jgi:dihydrofolate reductase/thymidylate synthase